MTTYIFRNGKIIEKSKIEYQVATYIISDVMAPLKNHATGKVTDSKSEFRKMTKDAGCFEIGNEISKIRPSVKLDRRKRREDIKRAIYELRNR